MPDDDEQPPADPAELAGHVMNVMENAAAQLEGHYGLPEGALLQQLSGDDEDSDEDGENAMIAQAGFYAVSVDGAARILDGDPELAGPFLEDMALLFDEEDGAPAPEWLEEVSNTLAKDGIGSEQLSEIQGAFVDEWFALGLDDGPVKDVLAAEKLGDTPLDTQDLEQVLEAAPDDERAGFVALMLLGRRLGDEEPSPCGYVVFHPEEVEVMVEYVSGVLATSELPQETRTNIEERLLLPATISLAKGCGLAVTDES